MALQANPASSGAAAANFAKPTGAVAAVNSGSGVFYTVPNGKYFVGFISWSDNRYSCQVNGINMFDNQYSGTSDDGAGSFNPFVGPITLYAGMTVGRHSTGGSAKIAGVEYDL